MLVGAFLELCRSIQTMNSMGILRGAGDVKFTMLNDILFLWGITIPCGIIAGLVFKWPVICVYIEFPFHVLLIQMTKEPDWIFSTSELSFSGGS